MPGLVPAVLLLPSAIAADPVAAMCLLVLATESDFFWIFLMEVVVVFGQGNLLLIQSVFPNRRQFQVLCSLRRNFIELS